MTQELRNSEANVAEEVKKAEQVLEEDKKDQARVEEIRQKEADLVKEAKKTGVGEVFKFSDGRKLVSPMKAGVIENKKPGRFGVKKDEVVFQPLTEEERKEALQLRTEITGDNMPTDHEMKAQVSGVIDRHNRWTKRNQDKISKYMDYRERDRETMGKNDSIPTIESGWKAK